MCVLSNIFDLFSWSCYSVFVAMIRAVDGLHSRIRRGDRSCMGYPCVTHNSAIILWVALLQAWRWFCDCFKRILLMKTTPKTHIQGVKKFDVFQPHIKLSRLHIVVQFKKKLLRFYKKLQLFEFF